MSELINPYDTLNTGRIALNQMYSGMTILWSGGTGTDSVLRNNNSQNLKNRATGSSAIAGGQANAASSNFTMAFWGTGNTASTTFATVITGKKNNASGELSLIVAGSGNTVDSLLSTVINGAKNIVTNSTHSTILGGYDNLISGTTPGSSGAFMSILGGSGNTIIIDSNNKNSTIIGGLNNHINAAGGTGSHSVIIGGQYNTIPSNNSATIASIGCKPSFDYSMTFGGGAETRGNLQFSLGGLITTTPNTTNNTITFDAQAGVGVAEGGFSTGTADIAEMFKYTDDNINNEDRKGLFVSLDSGGTISIGNHNVLGVVSVNPGFIGDAAELKWSGVYLKDIWGSKILDTYKRYTWVTRNGQRLNVFENASKQQYTECPNPSNKNGILYDGDSIPSDATFTEFQVPRINPNFDNTEIYVPRSKRQEWAPVGLLGKLYVRTAEPITGTHIDANSNGLAINGTKYSVLKHIKEHDSTYGIVQIFLK